MDSQLIDSKLMDSKLHGRDGKPRVRIRRSTSTRELAGDKDHA